VGMQWGSKFTKKIIFFFLAPNRAPIPWVLNRGASTPFKCPLHWVYFPADRMKCSQRVKSENRVVTNMTDEFRPFNYMVGLAKLAMCPN
jgi:hypothetical protein